MKDVNLTIEVGETVAIMAPSGAGKTTLLSILGGLTNPSAGRVTWGEAQRLTQRDLATTVGWIFQTANVLGTRTTVENVALGLYGQGASRQKAESRASDMLGVVGLDHMGRRRANSLSGGELQRLVVARALAGARALVLADEPTAQLDAATSETVVDAIFRARKSTTTLLMATHDPAVAERCDRRLDLRNGQVFDV
ncbi:MAG: ATP-binding cassette domain-containing protein [Gemmatimonadota bacterium]|nr:ATP-binding cassette domain-containing protein [Gemmatimonadota bacterium]MDH5550803.1 ATP-binding cassette domain-containing protein [Gemmatimonadota bacterium]